MTYLLDEHALRRPDWREGVPVTLWDGQEWTLPKPVVTGFYPRRNGDGMLEPATGRDLGSAYDELLDQFFVTEDGYEAVKLSLNLAALLLLANYHLTDTDLRRLLYYALPADSRHEENQAMWETILAVATGRAPKPTPVGSG
jgi:hypothetical protein